MSGPRSRTVLILAGIVLAVLVATLLWLAGPTRTPRSTAETASSSSPEAAREPPPPEERIESRPREAMPTSESPAPVPTQSERVPGKIEGRVLRRDGSPAAAGTLVIARAPDDLRGDLDLAERISRGDPEIPTARTGVGGGFALERLAPGASYVLAAVGNGALSTRPTPPIPEGASDVRIDVSTLYGIALELREADGGPLRTGYGMPQPSLSSSSATLFEGSPLLDLVGVDMVTYRDRAQKRLFLFTCPKSFELPALRHLPLRFRFVGYAPLEVFYDALPILPAIPQHVVEFHSTASGWGEILVEFADGRDPTPDGPRVQPFRLQLSSSSGPMAEIELPREAGPKHLPGIPSARYRARFLNALDQQIFPVAGRPSPPLDVGTASATLVIPLGETSELEIQVRGSGGRRYEGSASFSLARGELTADGKSLVGPTTSVTFDRAPYVLGALLPGHYALFVQEPAGAVVEPASSNGLFDLDPGVAKTVTLSLN